MSPGPAFCVAKGYCDCSTACNRFAQRSLIVRFLTFGRVTPIAPDPRIEPPLSRSAQCWPHGSSQQSARGYGREASLRIAAAASFGAGRTAEPPAAAEKPDDFACSGRRTAFNAATPPLSSRDLARIRNLRSCSVLSDPDMRRSNLRNSRANARRSDFGTCFMAQSCRGPRTDGIIVAQHRPD
jgi:hypothetical protein